MSTIHDVLIYSLLDLRRQLTRRGVPYRDPTIFPQKTVYAMRMLAGIEDQETRISLTHDLYRVRAVYTVYVLSPGLQ